MHQSLSIAIARKSSLSMLSNIVPNHSKTCGKLVPIRVFVNQCVGSAILSVSYWSI